MAKSLNTGHALYSALAFAVVADTISGSDTVTDLVTPSRVWTPDAGASVQTDGNGRKFFRTGNSGSFTPAAWNVSPAIEANFTTTDTATFVRTRAITNAGTNSVFFAKTNGGLHWPTPLILSDGTIQGSGGVSGVGAAVHTFATNRVKNESPTTLLMLDGTTVNGTGATISASAPDGSVGVFGMWPGQKALAYDCDMILGFNRLLTAAEAASLHAESNDPANQNNLVQEAGGGGGTAPAITTQPTAASVTAPATATFTAAASGSPAPTWQWQRSTDAGSTWANISGATSASYTTPATSVSGGSANNGDRYRAVATNASGTATTSAATLTVAAAASVGTVDVLTTPRRKFCNTQGVAYTGAAVYTFWNASTKAFVVDKAVTLVGGVPNAAVTDALFVAGTTYLYRPMHTASGEFGIDTVTAT